MNMKKRGEERRKGKRNEEEMKISGICLKVVKKKKLRLLVVPSTIFSRMSLNMLFGSCFSCQTRPRYNPQQILGSPFF